MDPYAESSKALASLFERGKIVQFPRGQVLIQPGDDDPSVYYIEEGFIKVYAIAGNGTTNVLNIYRAGDIVPLPGFMGIYEVESFYETMSDVQLRRLSRETVVFAIRNNNAFTRAVLRQVYDVLMDFSNQVNTLNLRHTEQKLVSRLVLLANRYGVQKGDEVMLNVPITQQDIADSISSTRETVNRQIKHLAQEGIIEHRNHLLVIKDMERLKAYL